MEDNNLDKYKIANEVRKLLASSDLIKAISYACSKFADLNHTSYNNYLIMRSRAIRLERDYNLGLLTNDEYYAHVNRVTKGVLDLLDEIINSDLSYEQKYFKIDPWDEGFKLKRPDVIPGCGFAIIGNSGFETEIIELLNLFSKPKFHSWVTSNCSYKGDSNNVIDYNEGLQICDVAIIFLPEGNNNSPSTIIKNISGINYLFERKELDRQSLQIILVETEKSNSNFEDWSLFDDIVFFKKGDDIKLLILNSLDGKTEKVVIDDNMEQSDSLMLKVLFETSNEEFKISISKKMKIEEAAIKILGEFFFSELPINKRNAVLSHGSFWILDNKGKPVKGKIISDTNLYDGEVIKILSHHTYPWVNDIRQVHLLNEGNFNGWRSSNEYRINQSIKNILSEKLEMNGFIYHPY